MKVVSWNVNSVRSRKQRLLDLLARHEPDVVCLQELKVVDDAFPLEDVEAAGYAVATHGQKTYNGVAILARETPRDVTRGFGDGVDDPQARFISAEVGGVRVASAYIPNGSEVGSEKYSYKQAWLGRLEGWLSTHASPDEPLVVCGDFNIAADERDVHDPAAWRDTVLFHPDMRARLDELKAWGLVDTYRSLHPDGTAYSWWDYRMLAFPKNRGLRIDYVFATAPLVPRIAEAWVDRDERKGKQPSDHAPVITVFGGT